MPEVISSNYVLTVYEKVCMRERGYYDEACRGLGVGLACGTVVITVLQLLFDKPSVSVRSFALCALFTFAICFVLFYRELAYVDRPVELQFYDDYLLIRCKLGGGDNKIWYSDIRRCTYNTRSKKISISGIVRGHDILKKFKGYSGDESFVEKVNSWLLITVKTV